MTPLPVTIITGFLGAGKTTLLNNLLRQYNNLRFVVVENEFGQQGIDSVLINTQAQRNVFELAGGCICCSVNDQLSETLSAISYNADKYDYVLLETTGIANPSIVIEQIYQHHDFVLDSVVCLADAPSLLQSIEQQPEAVIQIAVADVILINKCNDTTPDVVQRVTEKIQQINPLADIHNTQYANINNLSLLSRGAFDSAFITQQVQRFNASNQMSHEVQTLSFVFEGALNKNRFAFWLEYFLSFNINNLYRVKGVLHIENTPCQMVVQAVRNWFDITEGSMWQVGQQKNNRLVFIGSQLQHQAIAEGLESLLNKSLERSILQTRRSRRPDTRWNKT